MGNKYAVLIGVEESADLTPCLYAADELRTLSAGLETAGVPNGRQTVLLGPTATKATVESRFRKLNKSLTADDDIWFVFAGPAFSEKGRGYLACADTLADDPEETALAIADVFAALTETGAAPRFFLDASDLDEHELNKLFPAKGSGACLTSCDPNQSSHAAGGRRLWLQVVAEALAGRAPEALSDGTMTAGSLHDWVTAELPRAIRKAISTPRKQTPQRYGPAAAVLAEVKAAAKKPTARLDLKQLKRIVFRGESRAKVKSLAGFQKSFRLPDAATPSAQKLINRWATDDLKAEVEEKYSAFREHLGFKRKDLESNVSGDGLAFIRGPAFDYTVSVSIDPAEPTEVVWRREVSQVSDPAVLRSDGFKAAFGGALDTLQFDFEKPINIEALVDRIEDDATPGVKVRVTSDASACEMTVQGFSGSVHVERATLRIEGRPGTSPDSLVEQFFAFQSRFGGKKGLPAIGG